MLRRQTGRYLATGVANTALGLLVIYLLMGLGLHHWLANAGGYAAGLALSFIVNRAWTFERRGPNWVRDIAPFAAVFATAYLVNLAAILGLIDGLGANRHMAQLVGVLLFATVNFAGLKYVVFRNS